MRERLYAALQARRDPARVAGDGRVLQRDDSEKSERKRRRALDAHRGALRGVALFSNLSEEELARLAESAKRAPFAAGEVITRQGAQAHHLYVLTSGQVDVLVSAEGGGERRVATRSRPRSSARWRCSPGRPAKRRSSPIEAVECLRVDKDDFGELRAARPELGAKWRPFSRSGASASKPRGRAWIKTRHAAHREREQPYPRVAQDFFALER